MKWSLKNCTAISAVLIVLLMTVLDVTLVNVALPVLARDFGVSDAEAVYTVQGYQLVITMLLLPVAAAGDMYSYKRMFLIGVAIFTAASLACALSPTFYFLVGARVVQGIGAACVMGVNIALTRIIYPRDVLPRGLALNAMVIAVATAAGPSLAGTMLSCMSWHWLFLINVPLGVIAFILGVRLLPQNPPSDSKKRFDWKGSSMNALVFGLLFVGLAFLAQSQGLLIGVILLLIAIPLVVIYVRSQIKLDKGESDLRVTLPVDLFRNRVYSLSILTNTSSFIAQNMASIALPFLFIGAFEFSELQTGLLMTPWPLATLVVSPVIARMVEKFDAEKLASLGMSVFAFGMLTMIFASFHGASIPNIALRMTICGIGFGIFQTPNNVVMVKATPLNRTGAAGGMQSTARLTGQTLGASIVSILFATCAGGVAAVRIVLMGSTILAIIAAIFSRLRK